MLPVVMVPRITSGRRQTVIIDAQANQNRIAGKTASWPVRLSEELLSSSLEAS
jgi:hypothetical protein